VGDLDDSLEQIARIGYKTVQISAIGGSIKPQKVKELCDKHGLQIVITHSDPNRIINDTENLIEEHRTMGCRYIGLGSMPDKYRTPEWIGHFSKDYKEAAKKIKNAGMLLMYHNHNFEFGKVDGKYYIEYLMKEFEPDELGFTLDTYWLQMAGVDVCQWIERLKDRIPCVHLKDVAMVKYEAVMAPVLEGNMNFKGILDTLKKTNCEYLLVEQDTCQESPFTCLNKSYLNLSALGYR
jgi:sugar phosphate isomerase/epimerase